jgi:hypothetical protein
VDGRKVKYKVSYFWKSNFGMKLQDKYGSKTTPLKVKKIKIR